MDEQKTVQSSGIEEFKELKHTEVSDVVKAFQNHKTMQLIQENEEIKSSVEESSRDVIKSTIEVVKNENKEKVTESHHNLNKTACDMYGFKTARPMWQQKLMVWGASFWFVIYFIIASITVCPLRVFFDVFKNIFKHAWLAGLVAGLIYLAITVGIPLLTRLNL